MRPSSSITSGAIDSAQLTSAHMVKNPSERKIAQKEKPIKSGSASVVMCVAETHAIERNHAQKIAPSIASHPACKIIICTGRKDNRGISSGSSRFKTMLRPTPETTTQTNAATGASQLRTALTCG